MSKQRGKILRKFKRRESKRLTCQEFHVLIRNDESGRLIFMSASGL